jgi:alkylhydroperoxidase family enzyme
MTRKDYVLLAAALKRAEPSEVESYVGGGYNAKLAWMAAVCTVAHALLRDNHAFDSARFLTAAGMDAVDLGEGDVRQSCTCQTCSEREDLRQALGEV